MPLQVFCSIYFLLCYRWRHELVPILRKVGITEPSAVAKAICEKMVEPDLLMNAHIRPVLGTSYRRERFAQESFEPVMPSECACI